MKSLTSSTTSTAAGDRYATGINGSWHAIDAAAATRALQPGAPVPAAFAACGTLAQVVTSMDRPTGAGAGTVWLPYSRTGLPVGCDPCYGCAWTVALATGRAAREAELLAPSPQEAAVLERLLPDPMIAVKTCRAIITAAASGSGDYELDHPATAQLLTAVTAHAPVVLLPEGCADGDCEHYPPGYDAGGGAPFQCPYPEASAACTACSLQLGGWAGGYEGKFRAECITPAPCAPLQQIAAHAAEALDIAAAECVRLNAHDWGAGPC